MPVTAVPAVGGRVHVRRRAGRVGTRAVQRCKLCREGFIRFLFAVLVTQGGGLILSVIEQFRDVGGVKQ